MTGLTHIDDEGAAQMVDVSEKSATKRTALAEAIVTMHPNTLSQILSNTVSKGSVFSVARVAGIQAAKRTSDLIPLCHPLALSKVTVEFEVIGDDKLRVTTLCKVTGPTGVEMEALTAASVASLVVYDMCKAIDRGIRIECIQLMSKDGGQSGEWHR
jgi:cyclic pyranopterin phosphate synthase